MCAIFGIVGTYNHLKAQKAFECLGHRGTDESRTIQKPSLFLGIHRLAITDIHTPSVQPIEEDGVFFLMNGEIYNYQTLAQELGTACQNDTEVAFHAYKKWGDAFVEHLRGMFAIAIIEKESVKLFRDPFGKKPLYYDYDKERVIFASELKAILSLKPLRFDRVIIPQYLSYQSPIAPHTFDKESRQVEAGSMVRFDTKTAALETKKYFFPLAASPVILHDEKTAIQAVKQKLLESVALRMPAELECGALLSGGLDSSLIAAMASRHQKIHTFSIGYEGYGQYDERPYAASAAEYIGSVHHEISFGKEDFLQSIDEVIRILDEPLGDPAMLPLYHLMKTIQKEGIKVVLTGDGSDELFLGYKTYKEYLDLEQAKALKYKNWLRNYFKSHYSDNKEWEWYKRIFEESTLFRSTAEVFTDLQQNRLLRMNVRDNDSLKALAPYQEEFQKSGRTSPADWYSFLDLKIQLGEVYLRKLDRMSMAHSIEARSPFLDKEVVGAVFACDPQLRLRQMPKSWIKEIAKEYIPASIIERKKKGFSYPFMEWLQEAGELQCIQRVQEKKGLFHEEKLQFLLKQGKQGMFKQHLFSLYMLCRWIEKNL
ncbi:MAG: asparagine synthase (glutamine-hydrolyzing) [Sulfurovum sp.]|nr:asparagine synthase (glutamine-hydrolyzing) [Sulfurovum sp.]